MLLLTASEGFAHHGAARQFDQSKSIEVSGVVVKIRFVNPHSYVYFDVIADDGSVQSWRCDMRAATVLKRSGWSADMFPPGSRIRIEGVPARREPYGCYVNRFSLDDGEVVERYEQLEGAESAVSVDGRPMTLSDGQPNISGDWAAPQRLLTEDQVRNRQRTGFPRNRYAQPDAGLAASADFDLDRDNSRYHCKAVNIFADWVFDQHINRIVQTEETMTLAYGFMDIKRTIQLNMDEHPAVITPSRAGHSIGKWEGNTLVVDTIGFSAGYLEGRFGVMHSEQFHTVERFTFDPDEISITRDYVGDDPLYLTASFSGRDKVSLSGTPFDPCNCEDLTTEIVEGH